MNTVLRDKNIKGIELGDKILYKHGTYIAAGFVEDSDDVTMVALKTSIFGRPIFVYQHECEVIGERA